MAWPCSPRHHRRPTPRACAGCGPTSARPGSCRSPSSTRTCRCSPPSAGSSTGAPSGPSRPRGSRGPHGYHAVAVLRRLLGAGGEPVTVRTSTAEGPLVQGPDRTGRPAAPAEIGARHTVATLEFPTGIGTYDFTDGQWFHPLRRRHLVVRGSRGEIVGTSVVWSDDDGRPLEAPLLRRQTGLDGDLEGADLDTITWSGRTLYANPYRGARLSDEEIAIATLLERTLRRRTGEGEGRIPWRRPARTTCSPSRSTRPPPRAGP